MRWKTKDLLGVTAMTALYLAGGVLVRPGAFDAVDLALFLILGTVLLSGSGVIELFESTYRWFSTGGVLARIGMVRSWPPHLIVATLAFCSAFAAPCFGAVGAGMPLFLLLSGVAIHGFLFFHATVTLRDKAVVVKGRGCPWRKCQLRIEVDDSGRAWLDAQTPSARRNHRVRLPPGTVEEVQSILAVKQEDHGSLG